MFNLAKAFGAIFSVHTYSTENNMLVDNYINTNFVYFNEEAVVDESIYPNQTGRVRFQGSWWPARCDRFPSLPPTKRESNLNLFTVRAPNSSRSRGSYCSVVERQLGLSTPFIS
ncbi:NfeD family protein [Microcoleus sp. PH2017_38_RDM_U_B]|uniref:NfeD family protein n=2 Tax=unclassified Microcoleus TaxID=2642155 RepID=UPI0025DA2745|nr:NfeD family protein [Microcoleus sp. PH2017_38_RDM_U_B]